MATRKQKLTQRLAETVKPESKDYFIRDTQIPGFSLKVGKGGSVSWCFDYKHKPSGKNKRWKIGDAKTMPAKTAREAAIDLRNNTAKGVYPARFDELETIREICERYIEDRKRTWKTNNVQRYLRQFVIPEFGDEPCEAVTAPRVQRWITRRLMDGEPVTNLVNSLAFFRSCWTYAFAQGYTAVASPLGVVKVDADYSSKKQKPDAPKYALSLEDAARLGESFHELREQDRYNPFGLLVIEMLMYTGGRIQEMQDMKVAHIDYTTRGEIDIPKHKTDRKQKYRKFYTVTPQIQDVIDRALELRDRHALHGNPYLFPGSRCSGSHRERTFRPESAVSKGILREIWQTLRQRAGISKMLLKNGRSVLVSIGAELGLTLEQIAAITQHNDLQVLSKHYLTASTEESRMNAEKINAAFAARFGVGAGANQSVH